MNPVRVNYLEVCFKIKTSPYTIYRIVGVNS